MPWVLVVPHPMAAHHAAHAQALALQAMQTNAYLAAMQQQLKQAPPEPPRNLGYGLSYYYLWLNNDSQF